LHIQCRLLLERGQAACSFLQLRIEQGSRFRKRLTAELLRTIRDCFYCPVADPRRQPPNDATPRTRRIPFSVCSLHTWARGSPRDFWFERRHSCKRHCLVSRAACWGCGNPENVRIVETRARATEKGRAAVWLASIRRIRDQCRDRPYKATSLLLYQSLPNKRCGPASILLVRVVVGHLCQAPKPLTDRNRAPGRLVGCDSRDRSHPLGI